MNNVYKNFVTGHIKATAEYIKKLNVVFSWSQKQSEKNEIIGKNYAYLFEWCDNVIRNLSFYWIGCSFKNY